MKSGFLQKISKLIRNIGNGPQRHDDDDDDGKPVIGANPEELGLIELVQRGDYDSLVTLFVDVPYAERRKLNPLFKKLLAKYRAPWLRQKRRHAAMLGLLATSTASEVKKRKAFVELTGRPWFEKGQDISGATLKLTKALKADWAGHLAEHALSNQEWNNWNFAFELFREGLCERPTHVNFALQIPREIGFGSIRHGRRQELERDPVEFIRDHREIMVPEIERMFTLPEADKALSIWELEPKIQGVAKFGPEDVSFSQILVRLADEGTVDRSRLSRCCLSALSITENKQLAKWYFTLFEKLNPEPVAQAEYGAGDISLVTLLGSPNAAVTTWVIKRFVALEKAGLIDPDEVVSGLSHAIPGANKTGASAAIRLLRTIGKKNPNLRSEVMAAACEVFLHDDKDLQERGLVILEDFREEADAEVAAGMLDFADSLVPSLRERFAALGGADPTTGEISFDEPEEIEFREPAAGVLEDAEKVEPIRDIDALIEQISHFWQNTEDPMQLERILDGMTATAATRPRDFDERSAPLNQLMKSGAGGGMSFQVLIMLGGVIEKWRRKSSIGLKELGLLKHGGDIVSPKSWPKLFQWAVEDPILTRYVAGVGFWLSERKDHPMLSLPTHRGGWIDPRTLVERAVAHEKSRQPLVEMEGCVALLRLAPHHREEAHSTAKAAGLTGNFGRLLRYALGDDGVGSLPGNPDLQIAAGRARFPEGQLPPALLQVDGPFATEAGAVRFSYHRPRVEQHRWNPKADPVEIKHTGYVKVEVDPSIDTKPKSTPLPPALYVVEDKKWYDVGLDPCVAGWISGLWPNNPEPVLTRTANLVGHRGRDEKSQLVQNTICAYLGRLGGREHGEVGYLLSWVALNHPGAAVRSAGIDLLAENLGDAWFDPVRFAAAFRPLAENGIAFLNRIIPCLSELAQISPSHSHRVTETLLNATALGGSDPPRLFGKMLELLIEQRVRHPELELPNASRAYLESIPTKGKPGKLAKKLLG